MSFALLSGIKLYLEAAEPAGEGAFGAVCLLLVFLDTSSWSLVNLVSKGSLNSLWSVLHLPINVTFKHFQKRVSARQASDISDGRKRWKTQQLPTRLLQLLLLPWKKNISFPDV